MSNRCFQESMKSGPRKLDGEKTIDRCFDWSQHESCEFRKRYRWAATEIADGCPLPAAEEVKGEGEAKFEG